MKGQLHASQTAATAPASNAAIAKAAYQAYVTKDRATLEALLADDFHFTSLSTIGSTVTRTSGADESWMAYETNAEHDH